MFRFKYIIVRDTHFGGTTEHAIVFPESLIHKYVARCHRVGGLVVVSAGVCTVDNDDVTSYGFSDSLGIGSRPEDNDVLRKMFFNRTQ